MPPQQSLTAGLTEAEWAHRKDLFRRLIVREGDPAKVDLALLICRQYGFDPILKHVVLISGQVYVTRDGLLHIAHASGQFNGIEVGLTQMHDGEWAATATVYRKDMTRPIRYTVFEREHTPDKVDGPQRLGEVPARHAGQVRRGGRAAPRLRCLARRGGGTGLRRRRAEQQHRPGDRDQGGGQWRRSGATRAGTGAAPRRRPAARVAAQGEPDQAAPEAEPGEAALGWTPFWAWAKERGLKDRAALDAAVGAATIGMTPAAIKAAILAKAPGGEKRPLTAEETLEWLGAQDRPLKAQEKACTHLFSLSEDRAELEAWYAMAQVLCHQDAVDGAWFDRTTDLGWHTEVVPAVEEEPQEPDGGAVQGDVPGDEHPDDVPF
jgi:hypothetical protein